MKQIIRTYILMVLCTLCTVPVFGQSSSVTLKHVGSIPKKECPLDRNGERCARVIVELPLHDVTFNGAFVKDFSGEEVVLRNGSYRFWVSVSDKNKSIKLSHKDLSITEFPLTCDGDRLFAGEAYKIVIPITSSINGTVVFNIDKFIEHCVVEIDGNTYVSTDGTIKANLPEGGYNYTASATGYFPKNGYVEIKGNQVKSIDILLEPSSKRVPGYIVYRTKQIFQAAGDYVKIDWDDSGDRDFIGQLPKQPFEYLTPELKEIYRKYFIIARNDPPVYQIDLGGYIGAFKSIGFESIVFETSSTVNVKGHYIPDWKSDYDKDVSVPFDIRLKWVNDDWFLDDAGVNKSYKEAMIEKTNSANKYQNLTEEGRALLDFPNLIEMYFSHQDKSSIIEYYKQKGFTHFQSGYDDYLYINCKIKKSGDTYIPVIDDESTSFIKISSNNLIIASRCINIYTDEDKAYFLNVIQYYGFNGNPNANTYVHRYQNSKNQYLQTGADDNYGAQYTSITLYR